MITGLPSGSGLTYQEVKSVDPQIRAAVAKMLAEEKERGRPVKLTWGNSEEAWKAIKRANAMPIGNEGMDAHLPGMWYEKKWFVQNCRIYRSNGQTARIEDIPDVPPVDKRGVVHSCAICEYRPSGPCTERELVVKMLRLYEAQAADRDPNLCRFCFRFTSENPEDTAVHLVTEHPAEMAKKLGISSSVSSSTGEASPVPPSGVAAAPASSTPAGAARDDGWTSTATTKVPSPVQPESGVPIGVNQTRQPLPPKERAEAGKIYACGDCGKGLKTEHGLKIHRARLHSTAA